MSRTWTQPMEWENEGTAPSSSLETTGFVGGYKPPAGVFNYAFNKSQVCFEELQSAVDDVESDVIANTEDIKEYVGYTDNDIYGVEVDYTNRTFARLAAAVGKIAGSNFNAVPMYGRYRCNLTDAGIELTVYGESGYTETGALTESVTKGGVVYPVGTPVQVMVRQPKFYYRVVPLTLEKVPNNGKGYMTRKVRYYISAEPKSGFKLHPAFIRNGVEKPYIYLSAYEGSIYDTSASTYILDDAQTANFTDDKLSSIASAKPSSGAAQSLTRRNCGKLAENRGTGWYQQYAATVACSQLLFAVEYASLDAQSTIGKGVTDKASGTGNNAEYTGQTATLGNASGMADGTNGLVSVSYRGEENVWGNMWSFVDGINVYLDTTTGEHGLYIADHSFTENTQSTPYADAGITLAKTNGYISAMAYNEACDWLFVPAETLGDSMLPVSDYFYQNSTNGYKIARFGGYWNDMPAAGAFAWSAENTSTTNTRRFGGRVVYIPCTGDDDSATYEKNVNVDKALSSTSENPLQNKAIKTALDGKASTTHSHADATTSASGFMSATDKTKLDGVSTGATAVGKSLAGQSVQPSYNTTITASTGAEIFGDYRTRTFSPVGQPLCGNVATGVYSHAEGNSTTAKGDASHAEGSGTRALAYYSHAEGVGTEASGTGTHAEGKNTTVSGAHSHAEGEGTTVAGNCAHGEGFGTTASDDYSHAEGKNNTASGMCSHAEGMSTTASGVCSHAEGFQTVASGMCAHATGYNTTAGDYQTAVGRFSKVTSAPTAPNDTTGSVFVVGIGTLATSLDNALRVSADGNCYGKNSFKASGADYAEYFEWLDENPDNEDRRGKFVTLDGEKIRIANAADSYILGVVSATPFVEGDVQSETWKNMYVTDVFGKAITETVEVEETTDESGRTIPAHTETRWIINPEYNPEQEYISRDKRKEWAAIGMIGKLIVIDDGTATVNGYCTISENGIATAANMGYRVLARLDDTHIKVLIK